MTKNVQIWTLFSLFGYKFFFITLVSRRWGVAMLVQKHFHRNLPVSDPQIEWTPKCATIIEFPLCCSSLFSDNTITFLRQYKAHLFHLGLNQNRFTCKRVLLRKFGGFVWRENPLSPKTLKNAIIIDTSQRSNWILSAIPGLSSSFKISIESLTV